MMNLRRNNQQQPQQDGDAAEEESLKDTPGEDNKAPNSDTSSYIWDNEDGLISREFGALDDSAELRKKAREERKNDLAAQETRAVRQIKIIMILFLLACMGVVGWGVYKYISDQEQSQFEEQFQEDAKKVLATMGSNLERVLEAMDAFAVSMVSFARFTNQTWPFVVIPDFAVRAEKIRALANGVYVNVYPLVETAEDREAWEYFTSLPEANYWVDESIQLQEENPVNPWPIVRDYTTWNVIHGYDEWDKEEPGVEGINTPGPWLPLWQIMPVIPVDPPYNWDLNSILNTEGSDVVFETHKVSLSETYLLHNEDSDPDVIEENIAEADWVSAYLTTDEEPLEPISDYYYPIIDNGIDAININESGNYDKTDNKVVGLLSVSVYWRDALKNILPESSKGLLVVMENECHIPFTYQLDGANTKYLGGGDLHSQEYDDLKIGSLLVDLKNFASEQQSYSGRPLNEDYCPFYVNVYPSDTQKALFTSNDPVIFAVGSMLIFLLTSLGFIIYDACVERRHRMIKKAAVTSKTIVESLFPEFVREGVEEEVMPVETPKKKLVTFLNDGTTTLSSGESPFHGDSSIRTDRSNHSSIKGKPLAELFPDTTVLFADIAGFTAWSSVRDPSQVFTLLETIYSKFDRIAKRRKVFKVETIGDCYVAVCGLPKPQENHYVVMCVFARDCRDKMKLVTKDLETTLGPGTGDLTLRIGIHSGPTTAGVLRGQKARFQLFGDTVNTAARMESTGIPGMIQVSQKTADLLFGRGKGHWLQARPDLVNAKGKGMMQTYFVEPHSKNSESALSSSYSVASDDSHSLDDDDSHQSSIEETEEQSALKVATLVDWNVQLFEGFLEDVISHRNKANSNKHNLVGALHLGLSEHKTSSAHVLTEAERSYGTGKNQQKLVRDEVVEVIKMPAFNAKLIQADTKTGGKESLLSESARSQLRQYIETISSLYPNNPFHNFQHASHVMMSVKKLLQRIATREVKKEEVLTKKSYYDYTYGIASDPLTKFAVAFSALIHDVDHQGVPNGQLVKEDSGIARFYKNKSVAEQNSIDLAWHVLMEDSFKDLRAAIYTKPEELDRFRQLVVNCVIATDIFDKELKALRDGRWEKAFASAAECKSVSESASTKSWSSETTGDETTNDDWNRKATIVIEHIIQASDVAHTMQHWHIYQKWNAQLFKECYLAYKNGRADKDPSLGWYEGELWFFDNYIIPLAKKLKECEVFGVSCDEFLDFANENRKEWEVKGREIVQELKEKNDKSWDRHHR